MTAQPYWFQKGPTLAILESFANDDVTRLVAALDQLRGDIALLDVQDGDANQWIQSPAFEADPDVRRGQLAGSWLGLGGMLGPQEPQTGAWMQWNGPAEQILRTTLTRGAEVALGLAPDEEVPAEGPRRHWRVELFWKGSCSWMEGWVTWRRHSLEPDTGQVTVILCTPPIPSPLRDTPFTTAPDEPDYEYPVANVDSDRGMWVVASSRQRLSWARSTDATPGPLRFPGFGASFESDDGVVVVRPSYAEGGVRYGGTTYE